MRPDVIRHSAEGWIGEPEIPDFYLFIRTEGLPIEVWDVLIRRVRKAAGLFLKPFVPLFFFLFFALKRGVLIVKNEGYSPENDYICMFCEKIN